MKLWFNFLLLLISLNVFSQKQTFDITSFTTSTGWKKKKTDQVLQLTKENKLTGTYCIISIYKAMDATDDSKGNFDASWESLVKETLGLPDPPSMQPAAKEDGWEAQTGSAAFEMDSVKGVALLVSSTGYDKLVNILVMTNSGAYEKELNRFFESVSFRKPPVKTITPQETKGVVTNQTSQSQNNQPSTQGSFAYTTTRFDDGWTSAVQDDWVLTSKGDIKVYIFYALPFNTDLFSGTGLRERDYYWDNYVTKYYNVQSKQYRDNGEVIGSLQPDYVEGWATDKQTGERRFVAMCLAISPNTAWLTVATAKNEETIRTQFPNANGKWTSDLSAMSRYNKFAIGPNDIIGTWESASTSTAQWYYAAPGGGYGGYAGMTAAALSAVFNFLGAGNYTSVHQGATGAVGAMSTFHQEYKGNYTLTDWTLTATKRFEGKTENFNSWFEVVRGGRLLHLQNAQYTGEEYKLVKTK